MIQWYRFKNFQSYKEECFVDFRVNKKTADSYFDHELEDGRKVAKVMGVFGANGSGKSNLLKPLSFLNMFVPDSFHFLAKGEAIPFEPHFSVKNENAEVEIAFLGAPNATGKQQEYKYRLVHNENVVVFEELKVKTSRLYTSVFKRTFDGAEHAIKKNAEMLKGLSVSSADIPDNCSVISYLARKPDKRLDEDNPDGHTHIAQTYDLFNVLQSNLTYHQRLASVFSLEMATDLFSSEQEIYTQAKKLLMAYDLGIADINIREMTILKENGQAEQTNVPFVLHHHQNMQYELPIFKESSGTQTAYKLLASILITLDIGGIAVLDEFDNDLHPQLTAEILELFKNESTNPHHAQLIFSTHSPEMLKHLRKQHVYFTEKVDCESEAWRADEIDGLKDRDNLYSKYISGALGAVPNIG